MKIVDRLRQNCLRWAGFLLLSVCARGEITEVGSYTVASSMLLAGGLCITNGMAYVSLLNGELLMVDVNDPGKPTLKGRFETAGPAYSVSMAGTLAYVAEGDKGFPNHRYQQTRANRLSRVFSIRIMRAGFKWRGN